MEGIYWGDSEVIADYDKQKFQEFLKLPKEEIYNACLGQQGTLRHIINSEHFDIPFLDKICETAHAARKLEKIDHTFLRNLLTKRGILNYFHQASSRTFLSGSSAESFLGMRREEIRDIKTSSTVKGESDKDSLRTLSSYFDALVVRHPDEMYDMFALWVMKNSAREIPIINAGSGKKDHPTQGLLDYYTLKESFGNVDGKKVAFVGDCLRGRTVHSLAKILSLHKNITLHFVSPEEYQIDEDTTEYLDSKDCDYVLEKDSLENVIKESDVIYMTRIQNEHGGAGEYPENFIFKKEYLDMMKNKSILMHPMPKREEIDPAIDYLKEHPKVMYWRQQRNGMWTRVALFAHIFQVDHKIRDKYNSLKKSFSKHMG
jgi:aspartate carbamoyltransferase catalytic subunit